MKIRQASRQIALQGVDGPDHLVDNVPSIPAVLLLALDIEDSGQKCRIGYLDVSSHCQSTARFAGLSGVYVDPACRWCRVRHAGALE